MGEKGAKLTGKATALVESVTKRLAALGKVQSRKMFGGCGIFESGTMFAIVDSKGRLFLRADESNRKTFEAAGSTRHGRMSYFSVPETVLDDTRKLKSWAAGSVKAARARAKR